MSSTGTIQQTPAVFPQQQIESAIEEWWKEETSKLFDDPFAAPGTLFDVLVEVDSLRALNVLLEVEPILGLALPESLIRSGGYTDRTDMIGHLMPALRKLFRQRNLKFNR